MSPARELRELLALARHAEPEGTCLGSLLAERATELAPLLRTTPADLRQSIGRLDGEIAPKVLARLRHAIEALKRDTNDSRRERAEAAARDLVASARRAAAGSIVVDATLLFGELARDPSRAFVHFRDEQDFDVAIERKLLAKIGSTLRSRVDISAFIDAEGMHVRWANGRGGLNCRPQPVAKGAVVLSVDFSHHARQGAWLGDVLRGLGLPA